MVNMTRILILSVVIGAVLLSIPIIFEAQIAKSAVSTTDAVVITLVISDEITISDCSNFTMTGSPIGGLTGGTATGSCIWTVTTNAGAGFTLALKASTDPAMEGATYTIADYTEAASGTPDYTWSVAASAAEFGYTVEPATTADAVAKFLDDGSDCGVGSGQVVDKCWIDFASSDYTVINLRSKTGSRGAAEVIKFKAEVGNTSMQENDTYIATITATATTQ